MSRQKKKFKRGFKKWADDKSIELRQVLELKSNSPICAFDLCEHLKVRLLTPIEVQGLNPEMLKNLTGIGSSYWSAATIPLNDGNHIVIHNDKHSHARQQSNLMHELAHIICGHKVDKDKLKLGLSGFLRDYNEEQENEAEWLGACLQLPRPALLWALKKGMSEQEIALYYNASVEMTRFRINVTGVRKQIRFAKHY